MKKLIILLAIVSLSISAKAAGETDYAIVNGNAYFCEHAKVVFNKIRLHMDDDLCILVPLSKVDAYCIDGRIFHRLPLVRKNRELKRTALLELIATRNGLKLYRYCSTNNHLGTCFENNAGRIGIYYVYNKNNQFHLCVDERNAGTVLPFFGLNIQDSYLAKMALK